MGVSFICLSTGAIKQQPCFFATILLVYAPPKVILLLVYLLFLKVHLLVYCYIGRPSLALLTTSVAYTVAFICLYFLCCNLLMTNDLELVKCDHAHAVIWSLIFLYISWDHCCWECTPPVVKLRILNLLKPKNDRLLAQKL